MISVESLANTLLESIRNSDNKTSAYDTTATVSRVEGDTAWVHIDGGVEETPVKLTLDAKEGDNVQVRVNGGRAWLQGNATAPPTDDTTANVARAIATDAQEEAVRAGKAADAAEAEAVRAGAAADRAEESASDALTAAQSAQTSADSALVSLATVEDVAGVLEWITNHGTMTLTSDVTVNPSHVYFVVDAGGDYVVGSTHYSIVSEPKDSELSTYYELSVDKSIQNYVATHVVVNSEGLWLIPDSGGNKVLIATGAGSVYTTAGTYIIGKVNGVDTVFAKFTTDGATMNATNSMQIAHLGYGPVFEGGKTLDRPYYTFGTRETGQGNGSYSLAQGKNVRASGSCSQAMGDETKATADCAHAEGYKTKASSGNAHAEGGETTASGQRSHAEGTLTTASGFASHAENQSTTASGSKSHAEGNSSVADGDSSHAQNSHTIANGYNQTALGKYNVADTTNAIIIGNGTADNARSNALTIDWNGNVNIASGAKYKINGTALAASDVGAIGSNGGTMTGQLLTSFNNSVAMGSYGSAQQTVPNLAEEVRFSSGCAGSASINTAYTANGVTIATGWYNYLWIPHRSGGVNGQASGDNCSYGQLFLFGMNNTNGRFIVRVSSGNIQEVARLVTTVELQQTLSTSGLSIHSSRCSISSGGYYKIGKMVYVQLKLTISASLSANNYWTVLNGFPAPATGQTALAASVFNVNGGAISAHLNDSGSLIIETDNAALANNNIVLINGTYLSA